MLEIGEKKHKRQIALILFLSTTSKATGFRHYCPSVQTVGQLRQALYVSYTLTKSTCHLAAVATRPRSPVIAVKRY